MEPLAGLNHHFVGRDPGGTARLNVSDALFELRFPSRRDVRRGKVLNAGDQSLGQAQPLSSRPGQDVGLDGGDSRRHGQSLHRREASGKQPIRR